MTNRAKSIAFKTLFLTSNCQIQVSIEMPDQV